MRFNKLALARVRAPCSLAVVGLIGLDQALNELSAGFLSLQRFLSLAFRRDSIEHGANTRELTDQHHQRCSLSFVSNGARKLDHPILNYGIDGHLRGPFLSGDFRENAITDLSIVDILCRASSAVSGQGAYKISSAENANQLAIINYRQALNP